MVVSLLLGALIATFFPRMPGYFGGALFTGALAGSGCFLCLHGDEY